MCLYETPGRVLKNAQKRHLPASKVIQTRMHANLDTHTQTLACTVLQEDGISFTSIGALFK